jgi:FKBP-type peptidyl-prolyl cis-trans isomerase FkpA
MLKKITSYTLVLLGLTIVLSACKKEYESAENIDSAKIEDYLNKNKIAATKDPDGTGYYYQIVSAGTGDVYKDTDSVLYTISVKSLATGKVYYETPATDNLGTFVGYSTQLLGLNIKAIQSSLHLLKPGGVARILLPSYLGFGKNGSEVLDVPSNEILDITVSTLADRNQVLLDDRRIREFIASKGLTATKDPLTGVYYIVTQPGSGTGYIDMASTLTLNFTGRFFEGTSFDSSTDGTFVTDLTGVIPGWDILTKFTKGTKVRLLVPSSQGYGSAGRRNPVTNAIIIPGNANLDFDIEIAEVVN